VPATPRRHVGVLILALAAILAACGSAGTSSSPVPADASTAVPAASPSAAPSAAASPAAAFPVTVTDDEGTDVEIAAEPEQIVSLTPASTEILYSLGVGDRIVATDSGSDFPAEAVALPDVADFATVDVEAVVGTEPDLVVAGGLGFTPPEAIAQLRDLDIPVVVLYAPSVDGVYENIELLGTTVGEPEAATELIDGMRADIDAVAAAVGAAAAPRVFYEVGYTDTTGQIFGPADDSFLAEMVTLAGGDAITTGDPANYEIPLETLIDRDPEVIVLGVNPFYMPTSEQVTARPGWDVMTAVREGDVLPVQDIEITRPGPRLPVGLRALAAAVHPDVTLPPAP
jgi:iron complex transport system substrate-binding protein